jgi:predicted molibdopterin-dependent oxidoreductase YjgC
MSRIEHDVRRPAPVTIEVDGEALAAYPGESLAAALLAAGRRAFRTTAGGEPRGPFCNMGVCFDCLVEVDGEANVRACMTPVREGMRVGTR